MGKDMKEYTVFIDNAESCDCYEDFDIQDVIEEFKSNGFNVTEEAHYPQLRGLEIRLQERV